MQNMLQAGIYFWSDNSTLINNSGYGNGSTGIYIETGSNGNTLTNNFGFSNASYGIHIYQSPNTVLINNNGTSDATGSYRGGIFVSSSSNNNTLINNTGYVTKTGGATWSAGIYVNSNDNNLSNNIGVTLDLPGIAINGLNNIITNSNGTSNSSYGIYIWSSSNNTLTSSTGTSNSSFAIYLSSSSNNTLIGNTGTSNSNIALYLSNGDNNKFYNQTAINYLTGTNAYGIYMDTNSDNNIIQDCINVTGVKGDIFLITTSVNNTFINCSYRITGTNESVAAGSSLIRKWYYKAYVNDSNGTAISGANISAYNVSGTTEFTSLVTNSSGWTNRTEITEYVNYGGTRSYYNNYTINATYWSAKTGKFYNVSYSLNNLNDYLNLGNLNISSSLLMPANNTWSNNSNTNFTANVSTSIGVKNATVNIYNSLNSLVNQTSTTFAEGIVSSTFGIVVTLVDSVYKWFYSVFDWAGNQFTTENYTVNVDATYPQIDFTAPTPANSSGANTRFLANISLTELNLGNITYSWNGTNYTYGSNYTLFTPANLTEGLVLLMAMDNETSYGENSTYVVDFSGMGNNGTCSGTTCPNWSSAYGKLGAGGYSFDGVDDEINIPYSQSVNFSSNPFSISLWFNKIGNNGVSADSRGDLYSRNEFQHVLYISTGNIISFFWDNTDYDSGYTTTNNKYYHLVLSKNESNFTNLYIDGIFVISFNTTLKNMSTDNNMISIGGSVRYLNGSIDEVAIWNRSLSANEIKQLYESSLRKYSDQGTYLLSNFNQTSSTQNSTMKITSDDRINWKLLINQSGLVVGNRYNYFVSAVDLAGNVNTTETRTISGNMAPNAISVTPSPALAAFDDLDPGINFNVTANISDTDNNFDTAILQWKNSTIGSEWNNVTMNNITVKGYYTIVNANFTLPSYENNITYRIWINDTIGDANTSSNYTIQSFWDCTWTSTTDLGAAAGWDTNKWIGNISINNTGDVAYNASNCSLDFRLTYDITEGRIYYDNEYVKPSNTYTIPAKTNKSISINATLGTEIKQENVVITIDEFRLRSNTSSKNTTATLVTNQNGPYLYQKITGYSASVYLTAGNISLQGYLRNLMGSTTINETNTAYNVSFNWTIPAELENVSGNLSVYYENITESSMNYNNVNLGFSDLETATAGIKTIYLYAKGYNLSGSLISDANNNTLLSEKINISFLCYNVTDSVCVSDCGYTQDPDCSQPAATTTIISGGGGGGAGAKEEKSEAEYTLLSGKQQEFKLTIYNKLDSKKQDLKISVSGINSEYISISPNTISSIEPKGSKDVTVRITAPAYFTKGKYQLKFLIQGNIVSNQTKEEFKETRLVTIYIIEVSEAETNSLINDSLKMINEMNNSNMSIKEVSDLYSLMLENYNKKDYSGVKSNYEKLKQIHDNAFEALKIINELTKNLKEAETRGISILESKKLLYIAESAFSRGDYALALERLKEAKLSYALETKGEFNLIYEIKNHPVQYSFGTIMFILFSFGSSLIVRMNLYKRKLRMLGEEEKLLLELMKVVQRECFENNRMSMEEYETAMYQYESKLGETIGERIRIETKLAHMMKLKGNRRALDDEKKRLTEAIKKIQEDYIISGTIETRIYENMLKNYGKRLSEVEEEIVFIEAQEELNKNNLWNRMIRTISGGKNE